MTSQGGNLLGKERTSSIPVCLVMNVSGYGIDLHVGNRVIDMEDFLTTATGDLSSHVGSCELMFVYVTLRLMLIRIKINIRWLFEINEHPSSDTSPLRSQGQN